MRRTYTAWNGFLRYRHIVWLKPRCPGLAYGGSRAVAMVGGGGGKVACRAAGGGEGGMGVIYNNNQLDIFHQ